MTTTAPRFDASTAARVAAFLENQPENDPRRQEAEKKVLELARNRMNDEARALFGLLETLDRAAAVRMGLKALID